MLIAFVVLYLVVTIAIGLWAAKRVHDSKDYVVAGRSLPLYMNTATVFATWFGAETVLSVSAEYAKNGLGGVIADPFGSSFCLVIVALFFARAFYRMDLLTIGDFYRKRYNRPIEIVTSVVITFSYLGWTSAQMTALGLAFSTLSNGAIPLPLGIVLGAAVVLGYTVWGGMWSVALTDLFQSVMIIIGVTLVAWVVGDMAGGAGKVIAAAAEAGKFDFWPKGGAKEWLAFGTAWLTLAIGSVPQQDIFKRDLGQGRKDGGARYAARRCRVLQLRVCAHLHRLRRIADRAFARGLPVGGGSARDAKAAAGADPRAHTDVGPGPVLRRAAVGNPVHGERRAHRADRVMHGKHHQAVLPADDGPAIPSYAAHRAGDFLARRAAVCAELQEHHV